MNNEKAMKKRCPMMFMGKSHSEFMKFNSYTCIGEECAWFTQDIIGSEHYPKCAVLKIGTTD